MKLLDRITGRQRELASSPAISALFVMGEKGGAGKSTVTELASTVLADQDMPHTIAECEGDARLAKRLGERVRHHRLGEYDARVLANDPDLLNIYWDRVHQQVKEGNTIADFGANAAKPWLDYLAPESTRAAFRYGDGLDFALVATADSSSLTTVVNTARATRSRLPQARIHLILNGKDGEIRVDHPGVQRVLREAGCETPIMLPVCRAPDWGILKNLGAFAEVAMLDEEALEAHGIPHLRAGRALEQLGEWLLESCEAIQPIVAGMIGRRGP